MTHERAWLRQVAKWYGTPRDLAPALGLSPRFVSQLLHEGMAISSAVVEKIALLANKTVNEVLYTHPTDPQLNLTPPPNDTAPQEPDLPQELPSETTEEAPPKAARADKEDQLSTDSMLLQYIKGRDLYESESAAFWSMQHQIDCERPLTWKQRIWLLKACYRRKTG